MNVIRSFPRRTLFLELNELCPSLLPKFMAEGWLPNFKRLHDRAEVHVTETTDEDLEPWVQWVTFHTGVPQAEHGIDQLDEGYRLAQPAIWDRLAEAGQEALVFGVMNAAPAASPRITLMPDPWSGNVAPSTPEYEAFHRFVRRQVGEHANPDARSGLSEALAFGRFLLGHGLTLDTVRLAARQVLSEKTSRHDRRWARATVLDMIAWDVFAHEYRRRRPDCAFFFGNSVAFYQHRYWRHMDPDRYRVKPSAEEMAAYGDAIRYGYREMDKLVGKALALADRETTIVFATALSQQENLAYEDIGGKFVYRPRDFEKLLAWAGAPAGVTVQPVMTHEAWASYATEAEAEACAAALGRVTAGGRPVFDCRREGNRVFFCCAFISKVGSDLMMTDGERSVPFADHFALVGQVNNSRHHRDGCLWIARPDGRHVVHEGRLPLEHAADRALTNVGVPTVSA